MANGVIIPTKHNLTLTTDGLTFNNCTYVDGGYCITDEGLVFVQLRVQATGGNASVTGFPKGVGGSVGGWPPRMAFEDNTPLFFQFRTNDTYIFTYGTITTDKVYGVSTMYVKSV